MTDADDANVGDDAGARGGDAAPHPGDDEPVEAVLESELKLFDDVLRCEADLEQVTAERDDYLDQLRRNQAEFENIRKRLAKEAGDAADRAVEQFAERLLPVLDACDSAIGHGATEVEPIYAALLGTLEREGLSRVAGVGELFDPHVHEAMFHEPAGTDDQGTVVVEILRPGYTWKERTLRPAMVKVRG